MNRIKTRRMSSYEKRNFAVRLVLYAVIIIFCYVFSTSGDFRKPLLLIPAALCISTYAREHTALITGMTCGFLIDIACNKLLGFNALILCLMCAGVSLLYKHFLMHRLISFIVIAAAGTFIQGVLDYFFFYAIWDYSNVSFIFRNYTLPCCGLTLVSALPVYAVIHNINRLLRPNTVRTIEETVLTEDDQ